MKLKPTKKNIKALFLLVLILGTAMTLAVYQPGFEGAKCYLDGIYVKAGFDEGNNEYHAYADAEDPIAWSESSGGLGAISVSASSQLAWSGFALPNEAGIDYSVWGNALFVGTSKSYPTCRFHVESNIQLQDLTRQGDPDPLNWNLDDPLEGRRIEYWTKKATKVTETNETVTYKYELSKESFLLTPAEFWIGFYLVPNQNNAGTASGWREGTYNGLTAWFRLDFHTWDNAYYDAWLNDPDAEVYTTEYGGTVTSKERLADPSTYQGGFPIAGWIGGWEKADMTSNLGAGEQEDSIWYELKKKGSGEEGTFTDNQLYRLQNELDAKTRFEPSLTGSFISLYDEAGVTGFQYEPSYTDYDKVEALTSEVKLTTPDSSMDKTMYFPIHIDSFGTHVESHGFLGTDGYTIYYPSAYFRIRLIYGVYGTFKYLWTENVVKPIEVVGPNGTVTSPGLGYVDEFERYGTTVIRTEGTLSPLYDVGEGLADWLSNPFSQMWIIFLVLAGAFLLITFLNPGLWSSLLGIYKKRRNR